MGTSGNWLLDLIQCKLETVMWIAIRERNVEGFTQSTRITVCFSCQSHKELLICYQQDY